MIEPWQWLIIVFVLLGAIILLAVFAQYASLWLQCKMTRVRISLVNLIMMRLRKVNPVVIVRCMINPSLAPSYTPDEPLATFDGIPVGGVWIIEVTTNATFSPVSA